jgi:hypothetical protein
MQELVKTGKFTEINIQSNVKFWLNWRKYGTVSYSFSCKRKTITSYTMEHECRQFCFFCVLSAYFQLLCCCKQTRTNYVVSARPKQKEKCIQSNLVLLHHLLSGWPDLFCTNEIIQNLQTFFLFLWMYNFHIKAKSCCYLSNLLMNIENILIENSDFIIFSWQFKIT